MAGSLTDTAENKVLDNLLGTATYSPTGQKILLCSAASDSSYTEITAGGGYTAGGATITFGAASSGSASNNSVTWTNMPAATISYFVIKDSGGNTIVWGQLTTSRTTVSGDSFSFPAGSITVSLD